VSGPLYRVELTATELSDVRELLDRELPATAVRPRAPKLAESAAEMFAPDTGDAALDAFMMRSRARTGPPKPPRATPAPRFPFGLRAMNKAQTREVAEFNVAAVQAWQRLGYRVVTVDTPGEQFPGAHALDWR